MTDEREMSDKYERKPTTMGKEFGDELTPEERPYEIESRDLQSHQYLENEPLYDRVTFAQIPVRIKSPRMLVTTLRAVAAFSGMLSGLDWSVISGALSGIRKHFIASADFFTNAPGRNGRRAYHLNFYFGRGNSIIISCLWYTLGGGVCAGSRSVSMLFAGRSILGVGVGIEDGCVGIYISECVLLEVRGNLVLVYQLMIVMIAFGEIICYAVGGIFFDIPLGSWRWMLGSSLLFSTILLTGMYFLPDSPRRLVSKGKYGREWQVWKSLRNMADLKSLDEYITMEVTVKHDVERSANEQWYQRYLEVCRQPRNQRALVYAPVIIFSNK